MEDIWAKFGRRYRAKCVWLRDFQFFGDKSGAINHDTGVCDKLSKMLQLWCCPGEKPQYKVAVGKPEYKKIIEAQLGIPCLYNEFVMEVMWGIKNLMHSLVPEEKLQLAKEDRLQMSLGMKMLLNRYGFDIKPEIVSDPIIAAACALYDCDRCDKKLAGPLRDAGNVIKDVSNINCEGWDLMKLATAVKLICSPGEEIVVGNPYEMFSTDELSKLVNHAPRYKDRLMEYDCLRAYNFVVSSHKVRTEKHKWLGFLIKEAEKASEAGKADDLRSWGMDELIKEAEKASEAGKADDLRSWGMDELSCGQSRKLGLDKLCCGLEERLSKKTKLIGGMN